HTQLRPSFVAPLSCTSAIASFFAYTDSTTAPTYTLSLHDALPIFCASGTRVQSFCTWVQWVCMVSVGLVEFDSAHTESPTPCRRSEEHTSELQSRENLVCRLLLEKKKKRRRILPA